jgi:hypothetical protein
VKLFDVGCEGRSICDMAGYLVRRKRVCTHMVQVPVFISDHLLRGEGEEDRRKRRFIFSVGWLSEAGKNFYFDGGCVRGQASVRAIRRVAFKQGLTCDSFA